MSERMAEEALGQIQARADACFRAPWTAGDFTVECSCEGGECDGEQEVLRLESPHEYPDGQVIADVYGLGCFATPHAAFMAAARSDVPALVTEARRARAREAELEERVARLEEELAQAREALKLAHDYIVMYGVPGEGHAPGHCHDVPGIWNADNVRNGRAGKECGWCRTGWPKIRAALAATKNGGEG